MKKLIFFLTLLFLATFSIQCSTTTKPNEKNTPDGGTKPTTGKLIINELAAAGDPEDWFELYNSGKSEVDLSAYTLTDDLKILDKGKFKAGTKIGAGEYKVFKLNDKWPGFKLGKEEELGIYDKSKKLVDSVKWKKGDSPKEKSWGRIPNATGSFKTLDKPSPGKENP